MPREEKADQDELEDEEGEEEERNDPSLRSLMMNVMSQMREMRLENARLHNTIADLCVMQAHTKNKLAALEDKTHRLEEAATRHPATAGAPAELGTTTRFNINNNKRYRHHNEVEEFIKHNLPYLAGYDLSALSIKDLAYALSCTRACAAPPAL
jgi:peptidoglycan hydrolase CwlO-like protein